VPDNVTIDKWFPQPSVIAQVDAIIHHGGNNTFTECLYFAKPAIIMPYVWDGHDNATRVQETGHGIKMHRNNWHQGDLARNLTRILTDTAMHARLAETSAYMRTHPGPAAAARSLVAL
jgi:UDP:flavonoid glycosyltransferase YjiC (YdhE family)